MEDVPRRPSPGRDDLLEATLLARIAAGDREAFRQLYILYHRRLGRFLLRVLRRRELIEEVINDSLYAVWCSAGDFRGDSQVSTWIFGIAYRKALKAARKYSHVSGELALPPETLPSDPDTEARRELRECLDRALARLPLAQRMVVELAYYVGHSCEEIAVITTTPVNTIKTRLFHARQRLRDMLPELRDGDRR